MIAYCGLYCGECPFHEGRIADLARDLRKELRTARFDRIAEALSSDGPFEAFGRYGDCYEVLGSMVKLRCKRGCRQHGGNPWCAMRKCCKRKGYEGCWECDEFETCQKLAVLETAHGKAHVKNLRRLKRGGVEAFLEGKKLWYVKGD